MMDSSTSLLTWSILIHVDPSQSIIIHCSPWPSNPGEVLRRNDSKEVLRLKEAPMIRVRPCCVGSLLQNWGDLRTTFGKNVYNINHYKFVGECGCHFFNAKSVLDKLSQEMALLICCRYTSDFQILQKYVYLKYPKVIVWIWRAHVRLVAYRNGHKMYFKSLIITYHYDSRSASKFSIISSGIEWSPESTPNSPSDPMKKIWKSSGLEPPGAKRLGEEPEVAGTKSWRCHGSSRWKSHEKSCPKKVVGIS